VSGNVARVAVSNNEPVEGGQVLFEIESVQYELALQSAQANLEAARQSVGAAQAGVDAARAGLATAQASQERAQSDYDRMQRIHEEDPGAISVRRLESSEAGLKVAVGQVAAARASLDQAQQNLGQEGERNSRILQAQAALAQAQLDLSNTTVIAPDDGVVTDVRLDTGAFAGAGQAQMTFVAAHRVWIQADFTENNLGHIALGDSAELLFDALPGMVLPGTVREVGFGVDVDSAPKGSLPTIRNDRQWLRDAQRFPVVVEVDRALLAQHRNVLKVGSQVSVTVYSEGHPVLRALGWLQMRIASWLTYAY
jgi:multidrug resistance efflux pump